ncbi:MAG: Gfo/Idh/MocA family oxidoreductase [Clostridia bacterium]|nr:Gfo/Idh/MocA family oxidoreductase [Clostridia bacterium]
MIKVGLVGLGSMGMVHYRAYQNIENTEVVAVVELSPDMVNEKVGVDTVNIYGTITEMLEKESLDIIDICTPTYMHADMVVEALKSGAHVTCEKPMALCVEEAERVLEAAKESKRLFMVAHVVRFHASHRYFKEVVDSGELGKALHVSFHRSCQIPSDWELWRHDRKKGGGSLLDLSIHDLDFVQYVFGMPQKASCTYHKMQNENDFVESQLIYPGTIVQVTSGFYQGDIPFVSSYYAVFEKGYVECRGGIVTKNGEPVDLKVEQKKEEAKGTNLSDVSGHQLELQYFADCILQNTAPEIVTPDSAYDTMRLYKQLLDNCTEV